MCNVLLSIFTVLHMLLRGYTTVSTRKTDLEYNHRYVIKLKCGKSRTVIFRCVQHRHVTYYHRWFILKTITYTYSVEMVFVDGSIFTDYHIAHYPQLCSKLFSKTTYPHRCAVNAHIDWLKRA